MLKFDKKSVFFFLMIFFIFPAATRAEMVSFSADGEYVMGDNDTAMDAKALALEDAKRNILERVGTYIESTTEVKNGIVSSDRVKQYTAGIVKMETIKEERRLLEKKGFLIVVSVRASVDPNAVVRQVMALKDRTDVEEKAKKFSADNIRLREEIALMNRQIKQITDEKRSQELMVQRRTALRTIIENEKGLTMLVSGEALVKMSLLDRQKKQDDLQIIEGFLSEIADAYKVSSEEPIIEDNNDGTSNVTIKYSVNLPGNYFNPNNVSIFVPRNREFLSKGFFIKSFSNGGLIINCGNDSSVRCKTVLGPYFDEEVKKMVLVIKMGNLVQSLSMGMNENFTENKFFCWKSGGNFSCGKALNNLHYTLLYKASLSYTFTNIRHDELKKITNIGIKILYNQNTASPDKSQQSSGKKDEGSVNANQSYSEIKGIELNNGNVIEGQILYIDDEIVKIRSKDGNISAYSVSMEVKKLIKK